ncbi:Methylmalonate-semialdehyde dehydrogenase (CoA acylating) [Rhodotorula toruloides]|uniref:methylmalonate-semialdehyde dehydrogenase (CoA acylating) n=1 Tax=Rhodotorula toruloides TaxID=5286 RepID=A0A0K3C771_RHOTO|nr:Methylmalonate-semialdehyde dehydrogenase (CoA acylating) [Rhodotorula toruloides]
MLSHTLRTSGSLRTLATRRTFTTTPARRALADLEALAATHPWSGTATDGQRATTHLIGGEYTTGDSTHWIDVHDPSTQRVLTRVPESTPQVLKRAVDKAEEAFDEWKDSSILKRQAVMLKFQSLIREHHDEIARSIVLEQGKTFADAKGDVLRGLQVVENACGIPSLLLADKLEVSKDMDTFVRKVPLGVTAAVCPFNFPAMIPLWAMGMSIACGNSLILKPSERDPGATMILAELLEQAGLPKGVLQVVHGTIAPVKFICEEPRIKAISFVGGDKAGQYIYETGSKNGKRVQANLGAKNHCILMPDANANFALNSIVGAAFGAAGQRCMALSTLVAVGESQTWIDGLVERAKKLKVGNGFDPETEVGPLITPAAKERVESLIQSCADQGGKILLDGRGAKPKGYEKGNFVGPTILEATTDMDCYTQEIFGPVLTIVKADTLDDAIALINRNRYGNGSSVFTNSGATARRFEKEIQAGQVGINVSPPVPLPMFSWSGNKGSVLGGASLYGPRGVDFWTQNKTVTSYWRAEDAIDTRATTAMPTHH